MKRPKQANLKRLRALMKKYDLKGDDVAQRLGDTTLPVYGWLSVAQTTPIPTTKLQLLELLLRSEDGPRIVGLAMSARPSKKKRVRRTKQRPRGGRRK